MRRALAAVLRACFVIALAGALVGCGGDENGSASGAGPAAEKSTPAESKEDPSDETDAEGDLAAFCDSVAAFSAAESKLISELADAAGDPAAQQKAYEQFLAKNEQHLEAMIEAAPADIKESAEAYLESYRYYASGGSSAGKKAAEFEEKALKVIGYFQGNC